MLQPYALNTMMASRATVASLMNVPGSGPKTSVIVSTFGILLFVPKSSPQRNLLQTIPLITWGTVKAFRWPSAGKRQSRTEGRQ